MTPLNAFAAARLDAAMMRIDDAIRYLDGFVDRMPREVLLRAKGDLVAMRQLLELEADMREAAEEKTQPALRVVR